MTFSTLKLTESPDGIATLTLARPEKHNAFNARMIAELTAAARDIAPSKTIRAVIMAAEGESFCAGGDLEWMRAQFETDRAGRIAEARSLATMLRTWNDLPKPVIAAVQGPAYGGGVGLIAVCDTAIAANTAKFGLSEVRLGLIPATIGPYVAAKLGEGSARRVFMSGKIFGATEAVALGLVSSAVAPEDLASAAQAEARAYLAAAPGAVASAKALLRRLTSTTDDAVIDDTINRLADTWETAEAKEGISAFLEKRRPKWSVK